MVMFANGKRVYYPIGTVQPCKMNLYVHKFNIIFLINNGPITVRRVKEYSIKIWQEKM